MKTKDGEVTTGNGPPVTLGALMETDLHTLRSLLDEEEFAYAKPVHEIRKFINTTRAVLWLFRTKSNRPVCLHWKSNFDNLSRQFTTLRELHVHLQLIKILEKKNNELNMIELEDLRNELETDYQQLTKKDLQVKETIAQLPGIIAKASAAIHQSQGDLDSEKWAALLHKRHEKTSKKAQQLFKSLTLTSPSKEFHKLRHWTRYLYLQQTVLHNSGLKKTSSRERKQLKKLTDYLGEEHDLQVFHEFLNNHSPNLSQSLRPVFARKTEKLRKKILSFYPVI